MEFLHSFFKTLSLNFWPNSAKFILVLSENISSDRISDYFAVFENCLILKAVVILKNRVFGYDFFMSLSKIEEVFDLENAFHSGKVQNYNYKVIVGFYNGRIVKRGSNYIGIDISVMNFIAHRENSTIRQLEVPIDHKWAQQTFDMLSNGSGDICALPGLIMPLHPMRQFINTYDQNAYCALVPVPPRLTFLHFLLTPFDFASWIFLVATLTASAFIWQRLTKSFSSTAGFIFFVISGFFGQFVNLQVKQRILVILMQIFVLMTFVLGNLYLSAIISSMTASRDGERFKTFDELFESDLIVIADETFRAFFINSGEKKLLSRLKAMNQVFHLSEVVGLNTAVIATCGQLHQQFYFFSDFDLASQFYILPESTNNFFEKMHLQFASPFRDHLQLQHDLIFESGIREYLWRQIRSARIVQSKREIAFIQNEWYLLTLHDVGGIFYILFGGFFVTALVFIFEVVVKNYGFLKALSSEKGRKVMRLMIERFGKKRKFGKTLG